MDGNDYTSALTFQRAAVQPARELFVALGTSAEGLSQQEAVDRLQKIGRNILASERMTLPAILLRQFRSAFVYLLLAASGLSFMLGERLDAMLILVFILLNSIIGFYQEYKAEHSLQLLKQFAQWKTRVVRDGKSREVFAEEVVPGDVAVLQAGDMIPADGVFLQAENVTVDESPLTGESEPVQKNEGALAVPPENFYQAKNIGFFRTVLTSGDGKLVIIATGKNTAVGAIATQIQSAEGKSAFEVGIERFSSFILKLVLITVIFMIIANIAIRGNSVNITELFIFAIALIVGVIPEALPLVTTMSMSRGALHLARRNVVPRRLSAIEDLGSIEVLCTDKTGTITENKHEVADVWGKRDDVIFWALVGFADEDTRKRNHDVFLEAIWNAASFEEREKIGSVKVVDDLPFDPQRRRQGLLVESDRGVTLVVRGAPETVAPQALQHNRDAAGWALGEGKKGRRILAIATRPFPKHENAEISVSDEQGAELVGFVSFTDPLKPTTKAAIHEANRLGVRVKIITGDSKEVAGWVAYEIGLAKDPEQVLTGDEFERMSHTDRLQAVEGYEVFARTTPLQKVAIIETLQKKYLVGFLGEGFNDAPALKLAHVAIAVDTASDIAREASDIVLLNRSLAVIIDGIREGRQVFANTIKYIKATLTSNFGNFYALAFASLIIDYLPMLPAQILLLNLLTDLPMISIATDSVDASELRRPRGYNIKEIALVAIVLGLVSTGFDFAFFGFFVRQGQPTLHTMWFIGSVLTELVLLFSIRTQFFFLKAHRPGKLLLLLTAGVAAIAILLPFTPLGIRVFGFVPPQPRQVVVALGLVALYFVTTELVKNLYYRITGDGNSHVRS